MIPANDTALLAIGRTVETSAWRVHRYSSNVEVTALANAGRRGKVCPRWTVSVPVFVDGAELDAIADFLAAAAVAGVSLETMAGLCQDAPLSCPRATVTTSSPRGIEVDEPGALRIDGEAVRGNFSTTEWWLTFSTGGAGKDGSAKHDSHLYGDRRTARRARSGPPEAWLDDDLAAELERLNPSSRARPRVLPRRAGAEQVVTAPSWPSLAEAMALPVQPTTTTRDTRARRPANVVECRGCETEMIYHTTPAEGDPRLCTECEETKP